MAEAQGPDPPQSESSQAETNPPHDFGHGREPPDNTDSDNADDSKSAESEDGPVSRAPSDGSRGGGLRTDDLKTAIAIWVPSLIALVAGGLSLAKDTHLRAVTQGTLILGFVLIVVAELRHRPEGARERLEQRGWIALAIAWALVCGLKAPSLTWIIPGTIALWVHALREWDCRDRPPESWLYRIGVRLKRVVGWRTSGAGALALVIVLIAGAGTAGAIFAAVAEPNRAPKGIDSAPSGVGAIRHTILHFEHFLAAMPLPRRKEIEGEEVADIEPSNAASPFACNQEPIYKGAEWAEVPIHELLNKAAVELGEPLQGCVESLHPEYAASDGFAWGEGIDPSNKQVLSVVLADHEPPSKASIYLAPAVERMKELIHTYHWLAGPKAWPHYHAGPGDYYLADTANEGTCVLIRPKAGTEHETLPFTRLYPSVATAWAVIIHETKHWQWLTELPGTDAEGERVFELYEPGNDIVDARIKFNPRDFTARWHNGTETYPYRRSQTNIDPAELEDDVRKYLHR